jgi:hypothetical protein
MPQPFISYYEHIAKLAQVANKQTVFLAHLLHQMEFNKEQRQYYVDMSTYKKLKIMKEISPGVEDKNLLNLANQYLSKLKKADFIKNVSRGIWLVNPICYGQYRAVSKTLRNENVKVYNYAIFDKDGIIDEGSSVAFEDETGLDHTVDEEGNIKENTARPALPDKNLNPIKRK